MTPREELLAAAQVIRERGWCQRVGMDDAGRVCLSRALHKAGARKAAIGFLREVTGPMRVRFNDRPDQTADDVIAALEIAADLAA